MRGLSHCTAIFAMVSSSWAATANATPPPHAPNVCTRMICAEIFPKVLGQKYVVPNISTQSTSELSIIVADYQEIGELKVTLAQRPDEACASEVATGLSNDGEHIAGFIWLSPTNTLPEGLCLEIEISDSSKVTPKLMEQVAVIWITAPYTVGTPDGMIASPIERRIDLWEVK